MRVSVLIALLPVLSGCIAFPTFDRFEFRDEQLVFIEPGMTTRTELETLLVHDRILVSERRSGRLLVYADYRSVVGVIAENSSDSFGSRDYLVVEYDDEGRVVWFEALKGSGSCTTSDICPRKGVTEYGPDPLRLLVFAPQDEDQHAKSFGASDGSCNVYAWIEPGSLCPSRGGVRLASDNEESGAWTGLAPRGYLRWILGAADSGGVEARLEATHRNLLWREHLPSAHPIHCADGANVCIELTIQCRVLGGAQGFDFRTVPENEGREAVMERALILN